MAVTETYDLPFETEYDWRVTLFNSYKDLAVEAAIEIVQNLEGAVCPYDWKDDVEILNFAFKQKIIDDINKKDYRQSAIFNLIALTK